MSNKNMLLTSTNYSSHLEFWRKKNKLSDTVFHLDGNVQRSGSREMRRMPVPVEKENADFLRKLTKGLDPELFISVLAAFQVLFARYAGQAWVCFHSPLLRQEEDYEVWESVVPLAIRAEAGMTVKEWIMAVNEMVTGSYKHQNYPVDNVVGKNRNMLDSNVFIRYDAIHLPSEEVGNYDLVIDIRRSPVSETHLITIDLSFNKAVFDEWFVQNICSHFNHILGDLKFYHRQLGELEILSVREKYTILQTFNDNTCDHPAGGTIPTLFEKQAAATPHAIAVVSGGNSLTYQQLDQKANRLARALRNDYEVRPNDVVGILYDRSEWMLVAIMGILKAGAAYLAIEPGHPAERIRHMLSDSGAKALILQSGDLFDLDVPGLQLLALDIQFDLLDANTEPLLPVNSPEDRAYIIYTSGSTGKPKAVSISHRSLLNTQYWRRGFYGFDETYTTLQFASFSFDSSVNDIFSMLLWGGKLVVLDSNERFDVLKIKSLIRSHRVTNFNVVPSFYRSIVNELGPAQEQLKMITLAGEKLPESLLRTHFSIFPGVPVVNEYGPTENAICSTACRISSADLSAANFPDTSIGKPIANTQVYILDADMRPVPAGISGEICLAGEGLAGGYLNNPELTARKFRANPFGQGSRLYLTGDSGRWLPDGRIEYLGRTDDQVKIRGYRIEPGEITNVLLQHPSVDSAVVVAREMANETMALVAYLVKKADIDLSDMKNYLKGRLPDYMIPSHFVLLEAMPLTANNKLDLAALPDPESAGGALNKNYRAPESELEILLVQAWEEVLGKKPIGICDDFFSVGGDSIKAIQIAARMYKAGYKLEIKNLFENPFIGELAALIKPLSRIADQSVVTGELPLRPFKGRSLGSPGRLRIITINRCCCLFGKR
jgi:bacitracin synthase 3